jgi:hypothetical protein
VQHQPTLFTGRQAATGEVLDNIAPNWVGTFKVDNDANVVIQASFTTYTSHINFQLHTATFKLLLNGEEVGMTSYHFNKEFNHHTIPSFLVSLPHIRRGTHKVEIRIPVGAIIDLNDFASMVVSVCSH